MKTKHTQGKWYVMPCDYEYFVRCDIGDNDSVDICVMIDDEEPSEPEANARLIAAAPDLLEACNKLMFDLAESHTAEKDADHYGDNSEDCLYCKHLKDAEAAIRKAEKG